MNEVRLAFCQIRLNRGLLQKVYIIDYQKINITTTY